MKRFYFGILSLLLISSAALAAGGSSVACPATDDTPAPKAPVLADVGPAVASIANPLQVHCAGCHSGAGPHG